MSMRAIDSIVAALLRVPPEVVDLVADIVKAIAGSKTRDEAERRAAAVTSKRASEELLKRTLG